MNVLSLFDGMSCGQIALERAGIPVEHYFASEIDKYAIQITQKNYLNTIQLGDVREWKSWNLPKIDLLIAGSPCQGFSRSHAGLNFDDPRSKLFFVFVDVLKFFDPTWFLLENVLMDQRHRSVISELLGVLPIQINSSLVSAQQRRRLYWTNIPDVQAPSDKHIYLQDIIEPDSGTRTYTKTIHAHTNNDGCIQVGTADDINGHDILKRIYSTQGKSPTLDTMSGGNRQPKIAVSDTTWRKLSPRECERLQTTPDGYTEGVSNTQRYKMLGNGWTVDVVAHIFRYIPTKLSC